MYAFLGMHMSIQVAVVYHTGFGHTGVMAEAVVRGIESVAGARPVVVKVDEVDGRWDDLKAADAIIFGSPTYMGSVSGPFKTFMDKSGGAWFRQEWKDKIAAGFTNSGSPSGDKGNTINQMIVFAAQHSMIWVSLGLLPEGNDVPHRNRLGAYTGAMSHSTSAAPGETPPPADLATAEHLGRRVAEAAQRWKRGA